MRLIFKSERYIVMRELGIGMVMFSFATSDEDDHALNEFFRLSSLDQGMRPASPLSGNSHSTARPLMRRSGAGHSRGHASNGSAHALKEG